MPELVEMNKQGSLNKDHMIQSTACPYCIKKPGSVRKKRSLIAMKAARLFIEKGYNQTTIREISRATGMAMGNLYNYITKKENILYFVFARYHYRLKIILFDRKVFIKEDPKKSLRQFVSNFINKKNDFIDEMMMISCESRFLSQENLSEIRNKEIEEIYELEKIICAGVHHGVFRTKDTYFAAVMIMHQLSILALKGWIFEGRRSAEDVDTLLEDYILKAIVCRFKK